MTALLTLRRNDDGARRRCAHRQCASRQGAALLEGTIVLGVFLVIILVVFDLGLAVLRQNTLAEAARRLARAAVVRGASAAPQMPSWGPAAYLQNASHNSEPADVVRPVLVTLPPESVTVTLAWPDGGHRTGQRVTAAVACSHEPILPLLFGGGPLVLRAESTMRIEH